MYQLKCPDCGASVPVGADSAPACETCGWSERAASAEAESPSRVAGEPEQGAGGEGRKRRRRRRTAARQPRERSFELPAYAVAVGLMLVLWVGLAVLARASQDAATILTACGAFAALAGVAWLYRSAANEGVERMSFLSVAPRGLIAGVLALAIELIVMPVFCVVYVVMYFDVAWKPFLVEALGIGMCVTGALLLFR
jgi:hypothetical protein